MVSSHAYGEYTDYKRQGYKALQEIRNLFEHEHEK